VCQRVHAFLLNRAEKAKVKRDKEPTEKSDEKHLEAAKDVFVFVHLMELVESMTQEILDLRQIIGSIGEDIEDSSGPLDHTPEMFSSPKKTFLN
jgi:hypothetical protein